MDDKTRALLGDREAAKRLTDAGVVLMQGRLPGTTARHPGR